MKYLRKLDIQLVKGKYKNPVKGQVRDPEHVYEVFKAIKDKAQETLIGVYLSNDLEVNAYDTLSVGSSTETSISSDEVFNRAVITRSRFIILIHNHPSGRASPSPEDSEAIASLREGARWLKKVLLDFIIVGDKEYWSMFEEEEGGEYSLGPTY
jgi:DNA repair protein RadC